MANRLVRFLPVMRVLRFVRDILSMPKVTAADAVGNRGCMGTLRAVSTEIGGNIMIRRTMFVLLRAGFVLALLCVSNARAQQAFDRQWGESTAHQDWNRMYHYPYVYYPQNFWGPDYYRSSENMYFRYPPEMQIPVYNGVAQRISAAAALLPAATISS